MNQRPVVVLLALLTPLLASAQITMQRVGPTTAPTLTLNRGERVGFSARATSPAGGLRGSEWYQDGNYLGAQYRSSVPGSTESDVTFSWGFNFPTPGSYTVQGQAFDTSGNYSESATWTVTVGERPRFLYVDKTDTLLDSSQATQDAFFDFVAARRINQLGIYRLNQILGNNRRTTALRAFITRAHAAGVQRVFAIVATPTNVATVKTYLVDANTAATARFDGLLTENEYWNGTGSADARWGDYLRLLAHVRQLADERGLVAATYVGWFSAEEARAFRELVDIVLLHAYVPTPARAYPYMTPRLESLAREWTRPVQVWPILSAECTYSGKWFSENRGSDAVELAENTVLDAFKADDRPFRNGLRIAGFAYFARTDLVSDLAGPACGSAL
jgi:hypothetical protein